jgi:excinuclease ABC subunit C
MSNSEKDFIFNPQQIPTDPGCYIFRGEDNEILYVGKAKHLRNRVKSYFSKNEKSPKTTALVKKITHIETRIVRSEMEALILENNLIKEHLPKYNILLRDDKNFLYLRITNEDFPRIEITRRIVRDGSTYIGPHTSAKKFRSMIAFCQKIFKVRTCKLEFDGTKVVKNPESRKLPCLDFHIQKCSGPCSGEISKEEYKADVERMKKFLKGETKEVLENLREKMMLFAKEKQFEAAAKIRDLMESISSSTEKQRVEVSDLTPRDFVHLYREKNKTFCALLAFRHGKLLNQTTVPLHAEEWESDAEIIEKFLLQWHEKTDDHPIEIVVPVPIENTDVLAELLQAKIVLPQKGEKMRILEIAERNARQAASVAQVEEQAQAEIFAKALPELAEKLGLETSPRRIECYDISHFSGTNTVASQVIFIDGVPRKNEYRRFKLQSLKPGEIDDFKALKEILERRMRGLTSGVEQNDENEKWARKNEKILQQLELLATVLKDVDWALFGGLGAALSIGKFWREHKDFDIFVTKKHWKSTLKIFAEARFEAEEHNEHFFTFTKKGFPPIDISPLGEDLPLGKFTKKNIIKEPILVGKTEVFLLNLQSLLAIKQSLKESREDPRDELDIEVIEHAMRENNAPASPDLIVIDGGKGQLSSVLKVLPPEFHNKVISLAKREEEVFVPGKSEPLEIDPDSAASKLLQRCRDEAHRFAISFNRSLREKSATKSILDEIDGIGGVTRKKLLQTFGSVRDVRNASDEELLKVVSQKQLEALRKNL